MTDDVVRELARKHGLTLLREYERAAEYDPRVLAFGRACFEAGAKEQREKECRCTVSRCLVVRTFCGICDGEVHE